jgi:hypothetical protein
VGWASFLLLLAAGPSPPRGLAASALPFFSLTARAQASISAGSGVAARIWCSGCAGVCACVCGARWVLGRMPQWHGRDANATSRSRRGGGRARRGCGAGKAGAKATGLRCGCARTRAGFSLPEPRRGSAVCGAPASRARGTTRRRDGSGGRQRRVGLLHEKRHGGRREREVLGFSTEGSSASPAAQGKGTGTAVAALTDGAEDENARGCGEARPAGRSCAGSVATSM